MHNHDRGEQRIALIDLFDAMWNTQNVSGVLECFSEDVVVRIVCLQHHLALVYQVQHQLRTFVERAIPGFRVQARSHHVGDDRVIWMATVTTDHLRRNGVESVRTRNDAVVRERKIVAYPVTMMPEPATDRMPHSAGVWNIWHISGPNIREQQDYPEYRPASRLKHSQMRER